MYIHINIIYQVELDLLFDTKKGFWSHWIGG